MAIKKASTAKKAVGTISVVVCKLMENLKTIKVAKGATVQDVLRVGGIKLNGEEVKDLRVNGNAVKMTDKVKAGDIITAVPQVDGGL
jgi:putative ubiquitin-RnfH superfamily antitoxin RatB of RatAB toxin-antitoxin module